MLLPMSVKLIPLTAAGTDNTEEACPVIPSNPISATSISCPVTALAVASPPAPPTASIPAAFKAALAFIPFVIALSAAFAAFIVLPPILLAAPLENASIVPITRPLAIALFLIDCMAVGLFNIFLTPSLSNLNPAWSTSSFINSVKAKPVSSVALAPKMAPFIPPPTAPTLPAIALPMGPPIAPATAPVPAPTPAPIAPPVTAPPITSALTIDATDDTNN